MNVPSSLSVFISLPIVYLRTNRVTVFSYEKHAAIPFSFHLLLVTTKFPVSRYSSSVYLVSHLY